MIFNIVVVHCLLHVAVVACSYIIVNEKDMIRFCLFVICSMVNTVDLIFNYGGKWVVSEFDEQLYIDRDIDVLYDFNIDFMNYGDLLYRY